MDWMEAAKWIVTALVIPLLAVIWSMLNGRISKTEIRMESLATQKSVDEVAESLHSLRNKVVSREDFRAHEERDNNDRKERRETEITLFAKIDDLKDSVNDKFDAIRDLLLTRKP